MYKKFNDREINFSKYADNQAIHLSFSPQISEDQGTLNLKTEEYSLPNIQSFLTDQSNSYEQRIGVFNGKVSISEQFDYYLISRNDLLKLIQQKNRDNHKQLYENKENKNNFGSIHKMNQPLPTRQRSQTHFNTKKY